VRTGKPRPQDLKFAQGFEPFFEAHGTGDVEGFVTLVEGHGADEARQPVDVVTVEVGQKDASQRAGTDGCPLELDLCALAAIEHEEIAFAKQHNRGHPSVGRGFAASGPQEYKL
jgi:hypothetical protein